MASTEVPTGAPAADDVTTATGRVMRWRAYLPVLAAAALLAVVPLLLGGSRYFLDLATVALVYAGYAVAFNIIFGNTNQLFLCLGAFAGVGAYGTGALGNELGVPMPLGVLLSVALAAGLGAAFSLVSVRRRLDVIFVGIVTLTFSLVFHNVLLGQRDITGGETGMILEYDPGIVGARGLTSYYIFLAVLVAYLAAYRWVQRSHIGWAFRALRDDEVAAELSGIDVARYKMIAGALGSAMVGLVGALYAHYEGFFSPTTFELGQVDVPVLVMLAFGGIGSLLGPVVGAGAFTVVDALLRPLAQLRTTVYGVILLLLFLGFRHGIVPAITDLLRRRARR
ncbi:MAG TPA: branched-chain amino acid ABC transporter permease [Euzebyales bacterium]|nr:branched-chain amino acid ABC transporter permease [Euzebyales bacterium]